MRFSRLIYWLVISRGLTDDKSTLDHVMAWCRCWPRSMSPYGVTRPQWVKMSWKTDGLVNESAIHLSERFLPPLVIFSVQNNYLKEENPSPKHLHHPRASNGNLSLKIGSCHESSFVVTGDITNCRYHQWRLIWHYDNSRFSLLITLLFCCLLEC